MSRRILLADDSLTIQKVVELTFADTDYEVVAVSSGDELMQRLPDVRPDLVICDVIMPGRDGYDVCQEIKSSSDYLHLPVILLTGTFEPFDRDRAIAVGCSEIITKPFEAKKLVDAVERLAATPAAPPATAADTQSIGPEDLAGPVDGDEFEETEISQEFGPGEAVEEDMSEEAFAAPPEIEMEDQRPIAEPAAEAPQEEFETDTAAEGLELETSDLPEVELPPAAGEFDEPGPDPAETVAVEALPDLALTEEIETADEGTETRMAEEPFADAVADDEPFPTDEEFGEIAAPEPTESDRSMTTPIDVAAVMAESEPEPEVEFSMDEEVETPPSTAEDDADTQDFGDKPPVEEATEEASDMGLSDDDVDRIARRLLELAGDRIEHIAWDVIPDMAEVVVRERMRELEAEAEGEAT
jgi:CheY-like chemotaxis protein